MKLTKRLILLVAIGGVAAAIVSGCHSTPSNFQDFFYTKSPVPRPPVTNNVPEYNPADILIAAQTNRNTGVITPPVVQPGAVPVGSNSVVVQPAPLQHYDTGIAFSGGQQVLGFIPGWGTAGGLVLGLLGSLGKAWLNRKEANGLKGVAVSTIQGIETFLTGLQASGDPRALALAQKLKDVLSQAHDYADVMPQVQALISEYTPHTSAAAAVAAIATAPRA